MLHYDLGFIKDIVCKFVKCRDFPGEMALWWKLYCKEARADCARAQKCVLSARMEWDSPVHDVGHEPDNNATQMRVFQEMLRKTQRNIRFGKGGSWAPLKFYDIRTFPAFVLLRDGRWTTICGNSLLWIVEVLLIIASRYLIPLICLLTLPELDPPSTIETCLILRTGSSINGAHSNAGTCTLCTAGKGFLSLSFPY